MRFEDDGTECRVHSVVLFESLRSGAKILARSLSEFSVLSFCCFMRSSYTDATILDLLADGVLAYLSERDVTENVCSCPVRVLQFPD